MSKFNWLKGFGFGVLVWMIMFAVASAIVGFGATISTIWWGIALAILSGIIAYLLAAYTKAEDAGQALGYGALWMVIGIALDLIISQQFVSGLFSQWTYYLGYALILFAPSVQLGFGGSSTSTRAV